MRIKEPLPGPFKNTCESLTPTATARRDRPSLSSMTHRSPVSPMVHTPRVVQDTKFLGEFGQLETTLTLTNFRLDDRISVADFENHERVSTTVQELRFVQSS